MLVNNENLTTIWFDDNKSSVQIIDQRFLPHQLKIATLTNLEDAEFAIREMQVRGAPLIGVTAAFGMYLASVNNSSDEFLLSSGQFLKTDGSGALSFNTVEGDQWYLNASVFSGTTIAPGTSWSRKLKIGTGMTVSQDANGRFSFPSTGIWRIDFHALFRPTAGDNVYFDLRCPTYSDDPDGESLEDDATPRKLYPSSFKELISQFESINHDSYNNDGNNCEFELSDHLKINYPKQVGYFGQGEFPIIKFKNNFYQPSLNGHEVSKKAPFISGHMTRNFYIDNEDELDIDLGAWLVIDTDSPDENHLNFLMPSLYRLIDNNGKSYVKSSIYQKSNYSIGYRFRSKI